MTEEQIKAHNDAIEQAALIADPPFMHRKGKPGIWRLRRAQIAADIRACKINSTVR